MSKSKSKSRNRLLENPRRGLPGGFEAEDLDAEEAVRQAYDLEPFPEEAESSSFDEASLGFDLDRWRSDLAESALHRERLRRRDLRNGILSGDRFERLPRSAGPMDSLDP